MIRQFFGRQSYAVTTPARTTWTQLFAAGSNPRGAIIRTVDHGRHGTGAADSFMQLRVQGTNQLLVAGFNASTDFHLPLAVRAGVGVEWFWHSSFAADGFDRVSITWDYM